MKYLSLISVASLVFILTCCSTCQNLKSPFTINESAQLIELMENGNPVFVYRIKPKTLSDRYICNNYIHPLYNLQGDILTEESPPDHPYHRGIFWAWHQLYIDSIRLGDGWTSDSIAQEVVKTDTKKRGDIVQFRLDVLWHSSVLAYAKPFIEEKTTITVHKTESDVRKIDFEISLIALVKGVQMGGSADQKGYGGFCARIRLPDSLTFTSQIGQVKPQELQVKAGPWMDFSGKFGDGQDISGIAILCTPLTAGYPEPWILRQNGSMQNAVFPGRNRIDISMNNPVVLRYRLIIHNGNASGLNLPELQQEFAIMKID
jgi:hypothetical protein